VIKVVRSVEYTDGTVPRLETHYYISSLDLSAKQLLRVVVEHWNVETMHMKLDDIENYSEDKCNIHRGNAPEILSIFRKLGLNLISPYNNTDKHNVISNGLKESIRMILDLLRRCLPFFEAVLTKKPKEVGSVDKWRKLMGEGTFAKLEPILDKS
jgi:predicted transposase YbfD/YdcC